MGLLDDMKVKASALAGLLADSYQTGSQMRAPNQADIEMRPKLAKGLLGVLPISGDAISGYDAIQDAKQGNYMGAALNSVGVLPFIPSMGGIIKNSTVPIMSLANWTKHFPNIPANESYQMWKSQASDQISGVVKQLVDKLRGIGVMADTQSPYSYNNSIGGISSYNYVPGYGEVRISDHFRGSGLGNDRTFGNANDAFDAIKEHFANNLKKQKARDILRNSIGINAEMSRKEQIKALQNWITDQGFKGKDKDLYPWMNKVID